MILKSIRLHPFGKFTDRSHTFRAGLDILEGPNEFGKSTMSTAIRHALYTSTSLTPAKLIKEIGAWFPHPHGVECQVTLEIDQDDVTWTINKHWTKNGATLLVSSSGEKLMGGAAEQKIAEIIGFNQATWQYVFHTTQATLASTVSELGDNSMMLDDMVTSTSTSAAHDISPERFLELIDQRIEVQYKRWDTIMNRPEKGRGIDDPWRDKEAVIYHAYLAWQREERRKQQLDDYNKEFDRLQRERAEHDSFIVLYGEAVENGEQLRNQLMSRSKIELELKHLLDDVNAQKQSVLSWPAASVRLENSTSELKKLKVKLPTLQTEYENAVRQSSSEATRRTYTSIMEAKQILENEEQKLSSTPRVEQDLLDSARALEQRIRDIDVNIGAHKLGTTITAERSVSIGVKSGLADTEYVNIQQGASWTASDIPGQISFQLDGVTISVSSSAADIHALVQDRQQTAEILRSRLQSIGADSVESLSGMRAMYLNAQRERDAANRSYLQYLSGRSFEEWAADYEALKEIPSTRSMSVINDEMLETKKLIDEHEKTVADCNKQINGFTALYSDQTSLIMLLAKTTSKYEEAKQKLASLPEIPPGFETAEEFMKDLNVKSAQLQYSRERVSSIDGEIRRMPPPPTDLSLTDLADAVDLQHSIYLRAVKDGEALKRIRAVVERKAAETAELSPLQKLSELVSMHFQHLTNGAYTAVEMDDKAPLTTTGTALANFDVSRLSQGTKTSLALATRLALAESYLDGRKGVIMLDDPCVDMDTDRRNAAMSLLAEVGNTHQVIMFTCHDYSLPS